LRVQLVGLSTIQKRRPDERAERKGQREGNENETREKENDACRTRATHLMDLNDEDKDGGVGILVGVPIPDELVLEADLGLCKTCSRARGEATFLQTTMSVRTVGVLTGDFGEVEEDLGVGTIMKSLSLYDS